MGRCRTELPIDPIRKMMEVEIMDIMSDRCKREEQETKEEEKTIVWFDGDDRPIRKIVSWEHTDGHDVGIEENFYFYEPDGASIARQIWDKVKSNVA
jgi:hypothetical protein